MGGPILSEAAYIGILTNLRPMLDRYRLHTSLCILPTPNSQCDAKLLSSHLHDAAHGRCGPLATAVPPSCSLGLHVHWTASFRPFMHCSTTILISTTTPLTYMVRCQRYPRSDHRHLNLTILRSVPNR